MRARQDGAAPRRLRFQFSLRLVFAVITLFALVLGLRIWQIRRQEEAVAAVRRLGGSATAGDETVATGLLRPLFFPKIVKVNLQGTEATDDDLKLIGRLSGLDSLNLSQTKIGAGSLAPLGGLRSLRLLSLADTGIGDDDLAHVGRLTGLVSLDLSGTAVGDAGLEHLRSLSALIALSIHGSKVTGAGLEHLCGLPAPYSLSLDEGQITPAAVGSLQRMPGLGRVFVHVPHGTGKRAWELLRPLHSVSASGIRRTDARALWVSSAPWEDTIAGVFERIRSRVALSPRQEAILLDALVEACKEEVWGPPALRFTDRAEFVADHDPIRTVHELMAVVKKGDSRSFNRAGSFVASDAGQAAVRLWLRRLRDRKEPTVFVGLALGHIVRKNPEELKTIIPAILVMLQEEDRDLRMAAAALLEAVARGVWEQKGESPKAAVPRR